MALGANLVMVFPGNRDRALPSHRGPARLFGAGDGTPLAVLDGAYITAPAPARRRSPPMPSPAPTPAFSRSCASTCQARFAVPIERTAETIRVTPATG
jgi:hypothetical protein